MATLREPVRAGAALLALLVVLGLYALLQSPYFAVTEVQVVGVERLDPSALAEITQVRPGDNLLEIDMQAVARRVAAHPRVRLAEVNRLLPGTLVIRVAEHVPVAVVMGSDGAAGLTRDGQSVPLLPGEQDRLPVLGDVPPGLLPAALQASAELPPNMRVGIVSITFEPDTGIELRTRSGIRVFLGGAEEMDRKVAIAVQLLRNGGERYRVVDLRYPRSPVVRSQ
ncbi:MAG: FtsQ-type POTRA domain-containing protein [Firmicutes bacterium]|nr:FtsQ-type POTRA domain-containing protein [Bacillota bacterium]